MARDETLKILREYGAEIRERFGVKRLAVFGSTLRNEAGAESDVDVLVEFEGDPTFDGYWNVKGYLEGLLDHEVDLATNDMIGPEIRPYVERDLIDIMLDGELITSAPSVSP